MIFKTLHRKLKIDQYESHKKPVELGCSKSVSCFYSTRDTNRRQEYYMIFILSCFADKGPLATVDILKNLTTVCQQKLISQAYNLLYQCKTQFKLVLYLILSIVCSILSNNFHCIVNNGVLEGYLFNTITRYMVSVSQIRTDVFLLS